MMTYGPTHGGESLWRSLLLCTRRRTKSPTLHSLAVVPVQCLLVLGRVEEGNITRFIQPQTLFIIRPNPWCSIVEVGREDSLGAIDHEEWRVAGGPAGGRPQALEHRGKLGDPPSAKLV